MTEAVHATFLSYEQEEMSAALVAEHCHEPTGSRRDYSDFAPANQESAQASIQEYVRLFAQGLFAQGFIIEHLEEIGSALKKKALDTSLDLEVELYQEAWEEVERFTEQPSEPQVWGALSGLTAEARGSIEQMLRDQGQAVSGTAVATHLFEEATKDVLVTFLRDLNEASADKWFMEPLADISVIRARTDKAAKECVPAWLKG